MYEVSDNGIASDEFGSSDSVQDVFNLTLVSSTTRAPPYNLIGEIIYTGLTSLVDNFKVDLASCNTSIESSEFLVSLTENPAPNIAGSNWTYPVVNLQFDSESANFTVNGYFFASPDMLNSTINLGPDSVQGKIKIAFLGVIDPYHSDMLMNNSATPTWLRTVGFNNNPLNIGYDSGGSHGWPRPQAWSVFATTVLISILATCM